VLEIIELRKRYGSLVALDGCDFSVADGHLVGFVGANGAGKTTTMRAIFGLVDLDGGKIVWNGNPVAQQQRLQFGYMPEERGLYPRMRAADQLIYFARLHGVCQADAVERARKVLERLGLGGRAESTVEQLSHGNQQRVQLAAALVHEPNLLVLDEPFAGLDPLAVEDMTAVLKEQAARGVAVLLSSHQLELVEDVCDLVVIIDHGQVVASGGVNALRAADDRRRVVIDLEQGSTAVPFPELDGVELVASENGTLRFLVRADVDPATVLDRAERRGHVLSFSYGPPTLAELFREKVIR
jgi:ABC-2 type transport system ATP-binding protein